MSRCYNYQKLLILKSQLKRFLFFSSHQSLLLNNLIFVITFCDILKDQEGLIKDKVFESGKAIQCISC